MLTFYHVAIIRIKQYAPQCGHFLLHTVLHSVRYSPRVLLHKIPNPVPFHASHRVPHQSYSSDMLDSLIGYYPIHHQNPLSQLDFCWCLPSNHFDLCEPRFLILNARHQSSKAINLETHLSHLGGVRHDINKRLELQKIFICCQIILFEGKSNHLRHCVKSTKES